MQYITSSGDVWDLIAKNTLGSTSYLDALVAANPEHRKIVVFEYGTVINVPSIPDEPIISEIPPWQR